MLRKFWGIVPITAQDAKTIYEADKASLLYLTDGDEVVLHKGHMLEVTMTVSAGGPIDCFVVLLKSL